VAGSGSVGLMDKIKYRWNGFGRIDVLIGLVVRPTFVTLPAPQYCTCRARALCARTRTHALARTAHARTRTRARTCARAHAHARARRAHAGSMTGVVTIVGATSGSLEASYKPYA
jgi:hypothetical protein